MHTLFHLIVSILASMLNACYGLITHGLIIGS